MSDARMPDASQLLEGELAARMNRTLGGEERERLLEAGRLAELGRLAGSVAHEARTPLATIVLRLESAERQLEGADTQRLRRQLQAIREEAYRCRDALSRLMTFVAATPTTEPLDLRSVCDEAAALLRHDAMRRQVEIQSDCDSEPLPVAMPAPRLRQAVIALARNAVLAAPAGSRVRLEARRHGGEAVLAVVDDGPGLDDAQRSRLGEWFVSSRAPADGLGCGLAACRTAAEGVGGALRYDRAAVDGCSRFELRLPLVAERRRSDTVL